MTGGGGGGGGGPIKEDDEDEALGIFAADKLDKRVVWYDASAVVRVA